MSRFFVGQPVRVVCPTSDSNGVECRITRLDMWSDDWGRRYFGHQVNVWDDDYSEWCVFEPHELEPLTPPHELASWEVIEQLLPNIREGVSA